MDQISNRSCRLEISTMHTPQTSHSGLSVSHHTTFEQANVKMQSQIYEILSFDLESEPNVRNIAEVDKVWHSPSSLLPPA